MTNGFSTNINLALSITPLNLAPYKLLTATKLAETQKDQFQALLLEASQEGLHLLGLCYNIP
ncbi:hypothetical protein [Vibrio sp. 10N.222.55.E7]|uniref:hypothetical protein n=1 Tax=Vibrio sp. 10N.222.55.E7 TaxID=3229651 RepID=UPI0026B58205